MSIQWSAKSDNDGYGETVGRLYRGERAHSLLAVMKLTGGSELLMTPAELRELASVANLLARQIEADK
jgi:hypothetical protein